MSRGPGTDPIRTFIGLGLRQTLLHESTREGYGDYTYDTNAFQVLLRFGNGNLELYNLAEDLEEQFDLAYPMRDKAIELRPGRPAPPHGV